MSDYISDQLRAKAAAMQDSTGAITLGQLMVQVALSARPPSMTLAEEKMARKAAAEQAYTAALAEWQQLYAQLPETPAGHTLRELLDIHKPYLSGFDWSLPACGHCDQIGGYEREGVEWPCENYEIIREGMA